MHEKRQFLKQIKYSKEYFYKQTGFGMPFFFFTIQQ